MLNRLMFQIADVARRFTKQSEGIAAVEFALIAPIMATLFIGAVEMSQAITVNRRVTQIGSTTGDLVARADSNIADSSIADIMDVGSYLLAPFDATSLKVTISVVGSSATNPANTKLEWKCDYTGTLPNSVACTCPYTAITIPTGLVGTLDYVVIAKVSYGYKPNLFDMFMKSGFGGTNGVYTMTETVYLKPRSLVPQLSIGGAAPCGLQ